MDSLIAQVLLHFALHIVSIFTTHPSSMLFGGSTLFCLRTFFETFYRIRNQDEAASRNFPVAQKLLSELKLIATERGVFTPC